MTTPTGRRIGGAFIALLGMLGLSACNNGTVSATPPATSVPSGSSPATTQPPSASASASASVAGPTRPSDPNAQLKFGKAAVIVDDDDTFRITVKDLEVAPDPVYKDADLDKGNGIVYFVDFSVTSIKQNPTYFGTNSINGLFLHPTVKQDLKGAKRLYGDAPGCRSTSTKLAVGETGSSCYIYQIPGARLTTVTYNDYQHDITWSR